MTETIRSSLIVSQPGPLRESLQALLVTMLQFGAVQVVDDASMALAAMRHDQPCLVVIDFDPSDERIWELLGLIQAARPQVPLVVLVDDVQQRESMPPFCADDVVMKGCRAAQLSAIIRRKVFVDGVQPHRMPSISQA